MTRRLSLDSEPLTLSGYRHWLPQKKSQEFA